MLDSFASTGAVVGGTDFVTVGTALCDVNNCDWKQTIAVIAIATTITAATTRGFI
jgi:hypothetical protein